MNVSMQIAKPENQNISADAMDAQKNNEYSGEEDRLQIQVNQILMKSLEAVLET